MVMPEVTADNVIDLWLAEPLDRNVLAEVPDPDRIAIETRTEARGAGHYILAYQVDLREEFPEEPRIGEAEAKASEINALRTHALEREAAREELPGEQDR